MCPQLQHPGVMAVPVARYCHTFMNPLVLSRALSAVCIKCCATCHTPQPPCTSHVPPKFCFPIHLIHVCVFNFTGRRTPPGSSRSWATRCGTRALAHQTSSAAHVPPCTPSCRWVLMLLALPPCSSAVLCLSQKHCARGSCCAGLPLLTGCGVHAPFTWQVFSPRARIALRRQP